MVGKRKKVDVHLRAGESYSDVILRTVDIEYPRCRVD